MPIFAAEMARQFTDTEEVLRMLNQCLRKLERSDSEKNTASCFILYKKQRVINFFKCRFAMSGGLGCPFSVVQGLLAHG